MSAPRKRERPKGSIRRPIDKMRTVEEKDGGYPSVGNQLDALWKILGALPPEALADAPKEAVAVMRQVQAVKTRFPKRPKE